MLKFNKVSKTFKTDLLKKNVHALKELSFEIPEGKIIGFLGANGAGKTTSIKIAMDFIRPSGGSIKFSENLGSSRSEIFSNIGYLPERPFFYPHLTGREFCHYMGKLVDLKKEQICDQIKKWSPRFNIEFALDREIRTYSKGMLQRIGFLATLLHNPKLIILDEPLSGLDPIGRKELKDVITEVNKSGTTIFFSSHIVSDVEEICDSVIFIKSGELLYQGSVDKLIRENTKAESTIKYETNSVVETLITAEVNVNQTLQEIIENKGKIISIEPQKVSLEEIFYSVK